MHKFEDTFDACDVKELHESDEYKNTIRWDGEEDVHMYSAVVIINLDTMQLQNFHVGDKDIDYYFPEIKYEHTNIPLTNYMV